MRALHSVREEYIVIGSWFDLTDSYHTAVDLMCMNARTIRHDHIKAHARVLYIDMSSAFNTLQPHLLFKKMISEFKDANPIRFAHQEDTQ